MKKIYPCGLNCLSLESDKSNDTLKKLAETYLSAKTTKKPVSYNTSRNTNRETR